MKQLMFIILIMLSSTTSSINEKYVNSILYSIYLDYYLAIDVEYNKTQYTTIITNGAILDFLHDHYPLDNKYDLARTFLLEDSTLVLTKQSDLDGFIKVPKNKSIDSCASLGKNAFIKIFFWERRLKKEYYEIFWPLIAKHLIKFNVYFHRDSYTGLLIINKNKQQDK